MIRPNEAADPKVHETAIARRCVHIIQACLREEEWSDALREFYLVAREELDRADFRMARSEAESTHSRRAGS